MFEDNQHIQHRVNQRNKVSQTAHYNHKALTHSMLVYGDAYLLTHGELRVEYVYDEQVFGVCAGKCLLLSR